MLEDNKDISVVMCTYNGAKYLQEQLDSILNQTYPIQEIIIVDDASTDNTRDIIIANSLIHSRIKYNFNEHNIGFTKNFEKALSLAENDFIAISDQDDFWINTKVEKMMGAWNDHSLLVYCDSVRFKGNPPKKFAANKKNRKIHGNNPFLLSMYNTASGHAMILKKELLQKVFPIPKDVFYDWWIAIVACCNGGIVFVPEILVLQRAHDNNVTIQNLSEKQLLINYKKRLTAHLNAFTRIVNLSASQKEYFTSLQSAWLRNKKGRFKFKLFLLLIRHRKYIYHYKVRKLGIISHLKKSIIIASN